VTAPSSEFLDLQAALAGEYSLQREIGRGGMGIVYLARDVRLDRDVAIKVLPADLAHTSEARERFLQEARTAAGLSHPNIVPIHRVGEAGGFVFFVMSYVEGQTLGERLRTRGPLPPAEAERILREVAWALAYAHGRGIVHRDVKPDNILLEAETGRALVTDFGIAFGRKHSTPTTAPGIIAGTAHFMSPEQAAGFPVDGRSDLYALGVVGYLAVSGRLPFENSNVPALLVRQATEAAPSVARSAPGLPSALAAAIDRCLARDADARFASAEELAAALAPEQPRPPLPATLRSWLSARNPLLVPYLGWSAGFTVLTLGNVYANLIGNRGSSWWDVVMLGAAAAAPLLPIIGYQINQARRQFRAGHTLADLRSALEISRRERAESEALERADEESAPTHRVLRDATVASATWLAVTFAFVVQGTLHENRTSIVWFLAPLLSTMALGATSNALGVRFIPDTIREWWQTGFRERLWNSRVGEWLARRLGAPERSQVAGTAAFRATEAALGVAAGELYAALPKAYRDQLAALPSIVEALEAKAAEARAELEAVAELRPFAAGGTELLAARRTKAEHQLAESVAALESVRLDLLRLHAGRTDLKSLTTLLGAARELDEDLGRLVEAQHEVDRISRT
jgi:serine/threonine-protein kinase